MHRVARPNQLAAFTLVEMLLVVAVISLLISILLPALGSARESARRTVCGTHLNQIGSAIFTYRTVYQRSWGLIEYSSSGGIIDTNDNMISLVPSVPGLDTFLCPSTRNRLSSAASLRFSPNTTTGDFSSYESYGHFDNGERKTPGNCKGKESRIWMVFDMDNPQDNWKLSQADNHGPDGGNVLYGDMHVSWVTGGDVWGATRATAQNANLP